MPWQVRQIDCGHSLGNASPWSSGSTLSPEGVTADKDGRIITSSVTPAGLMRWTLQYNTDYKLRRGGGGGRGAAAADGE